MPATDVSIIIPTYHEAPNLRELLPRIHSILDQAGLAGQIIVVDDNSRDGTEEVCAEFGRQFPVELLIRTEERGLSGAVIHGMRHAVGDLLLVMDADLSHPSEKIPELLEALTLSDADFAIGSRYVTGGEVDKNWGLFRWFNSKVSTLLAWPLTSAKDPMAGFFAIRRARFESANFLDPVGYKIGLELMVKCGCKNVAEIPITFRDRLHGESKLTLREQLNYLRHLKRLYGYRLGVLARPLKFLLVGLSGTVIDLACFTLLDRALKLDVGPARALAIWLAMSWNFWLNRRITFSHARGENPFRQYVLFCLSCLVGATVNWSIFYSLFSYVGLFANAKLLAAICGIVAGTAFNYVLSDRLVFRAPKSK
jgi:dolichol-phosphate mannosyltransferase